MLALRRAIDVWADRGRDADGLLSVVRLYRGYVNPRTVVSTLPITGDGKLVLIRRAIEPGYGKWAQPGGFLKIHETAQEGAARRSKKLD